MQEMGVSHSGTTLRIVIRALLLQNDVDRAVEKFLAFLPSQNTENKAWLPLWIGSLINIAGVEKAQIDQFIKKLMEKSTAETNERIQEGIKRGEGLLASKLAKQAQEAKSAASSSPANETDKKSE